MYAGMSRLGLGPDLFAPFTFEQSCVVPSCWRQGGLYRLCVLYKKSNLKLAHGKPMYYYSVDNLLPPLHMTYLTACLIGFLIMIRNSQKVIAFDLSTYAAFAPSPIPWHPKRPSLSLNSTPVNWDATQKLVFKCKEVTFT
jgi:hypothetical protein